MKMIRQYTTIPMLGQMVIFCHSKLPMITLMSIIIKIYGVIIYDLSATMLTLLCLNCCFGPLTIACNSITRG